MGYAAANTGVFILNLLFGALLGAVLLRFMMQYLRISFVNPLGQFIIQITDPFVRPLRRIIPAVGSLDSASIVLAFFVHLIFVYLVAWLVGHTINIAQAALWSLIGIAAMVMSMYTYLIIISVVSSWIPDLRYQPVIQIILKLTEPAIAPFRKITPDLGGIDISPMLPLFAIGLAKVFLGNIPMLNTFFILGL